MVVPDRNYLSELPPERAYVHLQIQFANIEAKAISKRASHLRLCKTGAPGRRRLSPKRNEHHECRLISSLAKRRPRQAFRVFVAIAQSTLKSDIGVCLVQIPGWGGLQTPVLGWPEVLLGSLRRARSRTHHGGRGNRSSSRREKSRSTAGYRT